MTLLYNILSLIGFIAVSFGAAGIISRWIKESEERKSASAQNHREITEALARIEESLRRTKP